MGTNPLTWAIPTDEEFPFCIDCATSVVQRGKIEYYAREGKDTPAGMVISHDGSSMTDSSAILKALVDGTAALTPLGGAGDEMCGYKGYGYAAVVEILSAALTGGPFMKALTGVDQNGNPQMYHLGHFFFVINPEFFMGLIPVKRLRGTFAVRCAPRKSCRVMTAFTLPERRSGWRGVSAKTRAFPSARRSKGR